MNQTMLDCATQSELLD